MPLCVCTASKYTKDRFDLNPGSDLIKKNKKKIKKQKNREEPGPVFLQWRSLGTRLGRGLRPKAKVETSLGVGQLWLNR